MPEAASSFLQPLPDLSLDLSSHLSSQLIAAAPDIEFKDTEITSYSQNSYNAILGLYAISFPGLWSTIKRSTKAKTKRKTFVKDLPESGMNGVAGEIMAYFKSNNYAIDGEPGETITFKGLVSRSTSQAFFLTFCTALCLGSLALVLQIQFIDVVLPFGFGKPNWFLLTLLSPYAGVYYWRSGDREDTFELKMTEEGDVAEIEVRGDEEEIERMWKTLEMAEKGMVKVEPILK